MTMRAPALLVLADGRCFAGRAYASRGAACAPAVFSTAITGYQELFTSPEAAGTILVMTAPHIGIVGVNAAHRSSEGCTVAGVVIRDPARRASSWLAEGELEEELEQAGVVGICTLDTRALTRHLRAAGPLHAGIFSGEALPRGAWEGAPEARSALVEAVRAAGDAARKEES